MVISILTLILSLLAFTISVSSVISQNETTEFQLINQAEDRLQEYLLNGNSKELGRAAVIERYINTYDYVCSQHLKFYSFFTRKRFIRMYKTCISQIFTCPAYSEYLGESYYLTRFYNMYVKSTVI